MEQGHEGVVLPSDVAAGVPPPGAAGRVLLMAMRERMAADLARAVAARGDPADECDPYFELVFRSSGLGIALVGADWKLLRWNPALQAMLGYTDAELRHLTIADITHPDDRAMDEILHRELLDGKRKGYRIDKRYVAKGDRIVHARLTVSLVPGDESHVLGMVEDVSASWTAEEERDLAHRTLGSRVREMTALHDASRILQSEGLSVAEMVQAIVDLLPAAFPRPGDVVVRLSAGGESRQTPRFEEAPGTIREDFGPREGRRGFLEVGYLGEAPSAPTEAPLAEDRTLLRTLGALIGAAMDRRLAKERLHLAVSAGKVLLWEWDIPSGRVSWPGQFGTSLDDGTPGRIATFEDFIGTVHPEDRPSVLESLRSALKDQASGGRYQSEFRSSDSRGALTWNLASGQAFWDSEGKPVRMLGVSTDVTQRHALEEDLRQAQKMESIGRLAGGISHDFNNLLTTILGYAGIAAASVPEGSPARGHLAEVEKAADMAAGLVRQLLAFARKQELKPRAVSLEAILADMEGLLSRLLKGGVEIRSDHGRGVPPAMADPIQVQQVVLNLAVNARDAMPKGGTLSIRTRTGAGPLPAEWGGPGPSREWVVLEVEDTGTGLTPEVRSRLFEPFFTTKPEGKGTGLGLATVYGIVRQSGGFIEVESTVGKGTLFRVHLPAA